MEPTPFDPKWYRHKFRGPGFRYEIGLCIRKGDFVWASGGYSCGQQSDLSIAKEFILEEIQPGDLIIADRGYNDPQFFDFPRDDADQQK